MDSCIQSQRGAIESLRKREKSSERTPTSTEETKMDCRILSKRSSKA